MRITILGFAGSGKSTLARNIAKKHNIPHLELDRLFLSNGGDVVKPDDLVEKERIREIMREEVRSFLEQNKSWVSCGTYTNIQPLIAEQANYVIYQDIPLWRRQLAHLKRVFLGKNRHQEVSFWQDLYFTYDMIRRTREFEYSFPKFLKQYEHKLVTLRSYLEIDNWLNKLV